MPDDENEGWRFTAIGRRLKITRPKARADHPEPVFKTNWDQIPKEERAQMMQQVPGSNTTSTTASYMSSYHTASGYVGSDGQFHQPHVHPQTYPHGSLPIEPVLPGVYRFMPDAEPEDEAAERFPTDKRDVQPIERDPWELLEI